MRTPANPIRLALLLTVVAAPSLGHEDDPKILDRRPPVQGPGYRSSLSGGPGVNAPAFDAQGVTLLAWLPLNQLDNASSGNDCWGYVSGSGREYALIGTSSSTVVVEITDPGNPQVIAIKSGPNSLWRDIKVFQHYMYSVSEGGSGIQIFDLAGVDSGNVPLVNTITTGGTTATHNVAIDEVSGFLYRCGGDNNGCRIYDLGANPTNPPFVGSWSSRYIHDAQIVTYTSGPYAGKQVLFACSGLNGGFDQTGFTILDVTNKASIQVLSQSYYPNPGYSHQGWLSPDLRYFYLGDELDEDGSIQSTTHMFDVLDPAAPVYVGKFTNASTAITHNLYTEGSLIYEANYTSGVRVYDASSPTNPVEIGYFDTSNLNSVSFNGLWSVYPYFPSGTVIGSDLESGLFVWFVGEPPIAIDLPNGAPETLAPAGDTVAVTITEQSPGDLLAGSEMLAYDIGSGFALTPLSNLGGGSYEAVFPPLTCGDLVDWYVLASDSTGHVWTNPAGAPASTYLSMVANGITVAFEYLMEATQGWVGGVAGDTATTGVWVRVDPNGTAAQPEDDHTPGGTQCWVTGQGSVGGGVGDNDVDNGRTTLLSPVLDLSGKPEAWIRYWRWYSNDQGGDPNNDVFRISISPNGGSSWVLVEEVGPAGPETAGGWFEHRFRVADFVTPGPQIQLRWVAEDAGSGSIIEAAVDDFQAFEPDCSGGCVTTTFCNPASGSTNNTATIAASGCALSGSLTISMAGAPPGQFAYLLIGDGNGIVSQPPGAIGDLCLVGGSCLGRYAKDIGQVDGAGGFALDISSTISGGPGFGIPTCGGSLQSGETWNFQFWHRQPMGVPSTFSEAIGITFQ